MRVSNFLHMNQFVIETGNTLYFQSYDSIVAKVESTSKGKKLTVGRDWDYSNTTRKHFYAWLYEYFDGWTGKRKDVLKMLKDGMYNGRKVVFVDSNDFV